jgi:ribonucleoside-diphosphate reductase alpha chain
MMPLQVTRTFTKEGESPYASIPFRIASSEIRNPSGSLVFQAERI